VRINLSSSDKKENQMEPLTEIGNVNVLDLRKATEASIASIKKIGNVNLVFYTRETAGLITRMNIGNLNEMVELPEGVGVQPSMGENLMNKGRFKPQGEPQYLILIGQTIIEPDVTEEDIEHSVSHILVIGQFYYPEHLAGVIQAKARLIGQQRAYPPFAHTHFKSLTLDQKYLNNLTDGSDVAVMGSLKVPQVLPNELLERKLRKLFVADEITCHEENAMVIQSRLAKGSGEVVSVPAGFALVEKALQLDGNAIEYLPARKLYCTERVVISPEVNATTLDKYLDAIQSREMIICPQALKSVLAKKCNLFDTRTIFYDGELMLIDDARQLSPARLSAIKGKASLVVSGELTIDPAVTPATLADHLLKVHNVGRIACTPEQMGIIESLLGLREGELADSTKAKEDKQEQAEKGLFIGNMNSLAL
jgi:hypothetical protein